MFLTTLVVVLGAVLLAAALGGLALIRRPADRAVTHHPDATALRVRLGAGRLEIAEDDRIGARLDIVLTHRVLTHRVPTVLTGRPGAPRPTVTEVGGRLDVDARGVTARVSVRLPRGTDVRAEVQAGEIALWGSGGDLELVTGTGGITGRELSGRRVAVRGGGGDIVLHFAAPPAEALVSSAAGDVRLVVPDVGYRLEVEAADPGGGRVAVTTDPAAAHRLVVRSRGGRAEVQATVEAARR